MNRPIKFRGRDAYGKLHYGDLWQRTDGMIIFDHDEHLWQRVHPESVAQLIGVDSAGNEVYEGDIFVVPCVTEIAARLFDNLTEKSKLKEAVTNA